MKTCKIRKLSWIPEDQHNILEGWEEKRFDDTNLTESFLKQVYHFKNNIHELTILYVITQKIQKTILRTKLCWTLQNNTVSSVCLSHTRGQCQLENPTSCQPGKQCSRQTLLCNHLHPLMDSSWSRHPLRVCKANANADTLIETERKSRPERCKYRPGNEGLGPRGQEKDDQPVATVTAGVLFCGNIAICYPAMEGSSKSNIIAVNKNTHIWIWMSYISGENVFNLCSIEDHQQTKMAKTNNNCAVLEAQEIKKYCCHSVRQISEEGALANKESIHGPHL